MIPKISILGVKVNSITSEQALEYLSRQLDEDQKTSIVTVNTEFIVEAQANPEFKEQLNNSNLATADGIGVLWAARLTQYFPKFEVVILRVIEVIVVSIYLGFSTLLSKSARYQTLPEQITGVDFSLKLASLARDKHLSLFLLGELPGIAEEAGRRLEQNISGVRVAGTYAGDGRHDGDKDTIRVVNQFPAEIILVAYGAPKQEFWIQRNFSLIPAKIAIGVGGTFMFLSGRTKRAPKIFRRFGFEWLYRLITQPWRWRRQLALPKFIFLVIKAKILSTG